MPVLVNSGGLTCIAEELLCYIFRCFGDFAEHPEQLVWFAQPTKHVCDVLPRKLR